MKFVGIEKFKSRDTVCISARKQFRKNSLILVPETDNKRTVVFVFDAEFVRYFFHHFRTRNIEFCFKSSRFCVKARMNNSRIGFCRAHRDIVLFFKNTDTRAVSRKLSRDHRPDNARTDHCNIVHFYLLYPFLSKKFKSVLYK